MSDKYNGLDETKEWMEDHGFTSRGFLKDKKGVRFALVSSLDGRNYITCNYYSFVNYIDLDCEVLDRDPIILEQMKDIIEDEGYDEYTALIFNRKAKDLYNADRSYDLRGRGYEIISGNSISQNNPYMEQRKVYRVPMKEADLTNILNNKKINEGESFWKEEFQKYIDTPIKWVGNEYTARQLQEAYGWGVDFIVLGCANKCIEVGYHQPVEKAYRMKKAKEHNVVAYFIDRGLDYYRYDMDRVGKELKKMATTLDLKLSNKYYRDFTTTYPMDDYEEDE